MSGKKVGDKMYGVSDTRLEMALARFSNSREEFVEAYNAMQIKELIQLYAPLASSDVDNLRTYWDVPKKRGRKPTPAPVQAPLAPPPLPRLWVELQAAKMLPPTEDGRHIVDQVRYIPADVLKAHRPMYLSLAAAYVKVLEAIDAQGS